jgi:hypothetical protein
LTFVLDRAATVRLVASRKSGARYKSAETVTVQTVSGANHYQLKRRFGKSTLRPGSYPAHHRRDRPHHELTPRSP